MGFSRQEFWSGLPCPPPGDLPDPGIKPEFPALQADSLPLALGGELMVALSWAQIYSHIFNPRYFLRRKIFHISREPQVTHVLYIKLAFWIQLVWLTDNNSSCSFDGKTHSFITWVSCNTRRSVLISLLRMQYQFPHNLALSKNVFCWIYIVTICNDLKILFLTLFDHLQKWEQDIFSKTSIVPTSLIKENQHFKFKINNGSFFFFNGIFMK